ncbi:hypothetical protein EDD18DRAFT_1146737 [Armillaria luteobubalina]|uniref:Uncharacterized protein n=1 Tax=Armillaria luteobubalina TaxID=153913 RepID=A0AA39QDM8_9AGAR|nr:hypothetical protein EDD18DRAFT_1146737 [Armillaria luteobubalina]
MVVPHFGDYIAFKLDPVASLKYLKDPEVTKACEALNTTVYVACVTHLFCFPLPGVEYISVSMTLVSQGLSNGQPDRFIFPDMAVPILPNNSNPLSRPPLTPTQPLPWPDCYHPTLTATHCRIRNDLTVGDPWPDPKYQLRHQERRLENYHFQDVARRDTLKKEQEALLAVDTAGDAKNTQPDECQASTITLPLPPEHDAESQYDGSVHKTIETSRAPSIVSKRHLKLSDFLRSVVGKVLWWIPCLHQDFENYDRDLFGDPLQEVIEDIESVKQINDPWNFFRELDAMKGIEADYHERMKVKVRADINRAREKDEALYTELQSKMPKRKHQHSPMEMTAMSVTEDAKSGTNI